MLGEKYQHIFDEISPSLKQILLSPLHLRTVVVAALANVDVSSDNVVTGDYTLSLSDQTSEEQRESAIDAGFITSNMTLSAAHLKGVRYSAEGFHSTARTQEFARRHVVTVRAEKSKAAKILLTPVTVVADGALILGGLFLLFLILVGYGRAR